MADNLTQRGMQDRMRIAVDQDHELRYWSEKFGVTVERLKEAIKAAGPQAADVERYLKRQSQNP
jgi:hypothetical protein